MTENIIHSLLMGFGIVISEGQISNIIIKENAKDFTKEKDDILITALELFLNHGIDDTGYRENGKNKYLNILCNEFYSYFIVNDNKKGKTLEEFFEDFDLSNIILSCDDAKQWRIIMVLIQLCWVHEERHYVKLNPILENHIKLVEEKRTQIWEFYAELKKYKENPTTEKKEELSKLFDEIFSVTTDYEALNKRLQLTNEKKERLLTVLDYPFVAIHNNASENGIRSGVVKRNISNGTRTKEGTVAWENHLSLASTCKKLGLDYFKYILDIFKKRQHEKSISEVLKEKAKGLKQVALADM